MQQHTGLDQGTISSSERFPILYTMFAHMFAHMHTFSDVTS